MLETIHLNKKFFIKKCKWCGDSFVAFHHRNVYCCDECRKASRAEQNRIKFHKYYHKHKFDMDSDKRFGIGTGTLGAHRHTDFNKELRVIKNEKKRLRLK